MYFQLFFDRPNGIRTGNPTGNENWPWDLMYEDLMWAMEKLQSPDATMREKRMASTIMQAWLGQVENMRVHHQENASNQPVDA